MGDPMMARIEALVEASETQVLGEHHFVALVTLDSKMRYGVVDDGSWAVVEGERLSLFEPGRESLFVEVLEVPRAEFDERLERGGSERGFDGEEVLYSFPVLELVEAMLRSPSPHFRRISLMWLLPTELRALREAIEAVAQDRSMPAALRELAQRMVVPAG